MDGNGTPAPRQRREGSEQRGGKGKQTPGPVVRCSLPVTIHVTVDEISILRAFLSKEIDAIINQGDLPIRV
jgi:hypothetical protein